jgi:hypothetical protein
MEDWKRSGSEAGIRHGVWPQNLLSVYNHNTLVRAYIEQYVGGPVTGFWAVSVCVCAAGSEPKHSHVHPLQRPTFD